MKDTIALPKHLSTGSRKWARGISKAWVLEPHKVELLIQAAEQRDRIAQAQHQIRTQGAYYVDRWGCPKSNPALRDERDGQTVLSRLLRELNLSEEPEEPRPPILRYK